MAEEKQPFKQGGKKKGKDKPEPPPKKSSGWSEDAMRSRRDRQAAKRQTKLAARLTRHQEKLIAKGRAVLVDGKVVPVKPPRLTEAEKQAKWGNRQPEVPEKNNPDRQWGLVDFAPPEFIEAAAAALDAEEDRQNAAQAAVEASVVNVTGSAAYDPAQAAGVPTVSIPALSQQVDEAVAAIAAGNARLMVEAFNVIDPVKAKRSAAAKKAAETRKRKKAVKAATAETIALAKIKAKPGRKKKL